MVAEANAGDVLKKPRGKTSSKSDEKRDASSIALQGTLEEMMRKNEVREEEDQREEGANEDIPKSPNEEA